MQGCCVADRNSSLMNATHRALRGLTARPITSILPLNALLQIRRGCMKLESTHWGLKMYAGGATINKYTSMSSFWFCSTMPDRTTALLQQTAVVSIEFQSAVVNRPVTSHTVPQWRRQVAWQCTVKSTALHPQWSIPSGEMS